MSKSTRGFRAAGIASLAVSVSIGVAAPAFAVEGFTLERIGGEDRYETAALVADEYSATNDNVILANGQPGFYADALASNYLAGVLDAPILLTNMKQIPEYTLDQLDQMNAQTVTVVGGEGVVPPAQVEQLEDAGYTVERVAGDDRFETNADVIAEGGAATDGIGLIATGFDFPDALAAGPFAYQGHPLGLSTEDSVKDVVLDALVADGVEEVLIFGGESVVGQGVEDDLASRGITVLERFDGDDRSDTSELAAEWALENLDFVDTHVGVASGYTEGYGADALAGGPLEGKEMSPMLITRNVDNPDDALDYIAAHSDTLEDGHLYGGPGAVSVAAEAAMEEAGQGDAPASNQDYTVTPAGNQSDETGGTDVDYTITGIPAGTTTVDIALVNCDNVTVSDTGLATFKDAENTDTDAELEGDNKADGIDSTDNTDTPAFITERNGTATTGEPEYLNDVAVVNGSVTFSVNSNEVTCVNAVVFDDANDNDALDLDANNQPTEAFSVTGDLQFTAPAAKTGAMDENVTSTDKANNKFTGCEITAPTTGGPAGPGSGWGAGESGTETSSTTDCATFTYDSNDRFYQGSNTLANQLTLEEFEAMLSPGDDVRGDYNANPSLVSEFILTDEAPTPAQNVVANSTRTDAVVVTWDDSATTTVDSYNIYRFRETSTQPCFTPTDDETLTNGSASGTYTLLANVPDESATPGSDGKYTYTDNAVAAGATYCYLVRAVDDGDESPNSNTDPATVPTTNPPAETVRPVSNDAVVTTNGPGFTGTFDTGDVFKVVFNEAMAAPNSGDSIRATDGDGTVADFVNGTNATFSLNSSAETVNGVSRPANTVLTVTLLGSPTVVTAGTSTGLQIPATVTDQAGNTDLVGNPWDVPASPDRIIDQDAQDNNPTGVGQAPEAQAAEFTNSDAADNGTFGDAAGDELTVTYDETLAAPVATSSVTVDTNGATAGGTATITCDGTNVVCTRANDGGTNNQLVLTVANVAADDVIFDGTDDSVTGSTDVEDTDGNEATGYPVAIG